MTVTTLVVGIPKGMIMVPGTGETFDLTVPEQVLAASHALGQIAQQARDEKSKVDEIIRGMLQAGAATTLQIGQYEAQEGSGRATYDAEKIYDAALKAGIPQDAVERMVPLERKVKDGRELNKLANRDDAWKTAMALGTKRSRGSIFVELKQAQAPAPETPKEIQGVVQERQAEEQAAEEMGV